MTDENEPASGGAQPGPVRPKGILGLAMALIRPPEKPTGEEVRLLFLLAGAMFVSQYDLTLFGLALKQIQESLSMADADVGRYTAMIRLGVVPAIFIALGGDLAGRRRMLLITIVGVMAATCATALAQTPEQFATAQFLTRMFAVAEDMLSIVVLAEEVRPALRGWALGLFGAMGSVGSGLAAGLFSLVDLLPYGWRALFMVGTVPLIAIAWFRRKMPETRRFTEHRARYGPARAADVFAPLFTLLRLYPERLLVLAGSVMPFAIAIAPAVFFTPKYLQDSHGFSPGNVSALIIFGGAISLFGNVVVGRLSDRVGRRITLASGILITSVTAVILYMAPTPAIAIPAWIIMIFAYFGVDVLIGALGAELFPTAFRATASALRAMLSAIAAATGLMLQSELLAAGFSFAQGLALLAAVAPLGALIAYSFLIETATRDLDDIAPDPHPGQRH